MHWLISRYRDRTHANDEQNRALVNFMEENPHFARNEQGGPYSFANSEKKWDELTSLLNGFGSPTKTTKQWQSVC